MATKKLTPTKKTAGVPAGAPDPLEVPSVPIAPIADPSGVAPLTGIAVKPSLAPEPKVAAGAGAGAFGTVLVWALSQAGINLPPEVAVALVSLLSFGVAWITSNKK